MRIGGKAWKTLNAAIAGQYLILLNPNALFADTLTHPEQNLSL